MSKKEKPKSIMLKVQNIKVITKIEIEKAGGKNNG